MRSWDPIEKLWKANPSIDDLVVQIVAKYYGDPTILEDKEVIVVATEGDDPYGAMLRLAPDGVLKKVFRLIAAAVHPDAGGTGEQMTRANQAWEAIRKDRGDMRMLMGLVKKNDGEGALEKLRRQKDIAKQIESGALSVRGGVQEALICIDASASMHDATTLRRQGKYDDAYYYQDYGERWTAAIRASQLLVDASRSSKIGLVAFDDRIVSDLKVGGSSADITGLLRSTLPRNGTCFAGAIHRSLKLLSASEAMPVKRIVLLSDGADGLHRGRAFFDEQLELCVTRKVIIDTVGFGDSPDEQLLRSIAKRTGGVYRKAADAQELVRSFKQLEAGVRGLLASGS